MWSIYVKIHYCVFSKTIRSLSLALCVCVCVRVCVCVCVCVCVPPRLGDAAPEAWLVRGTITNHPSFLLVTHMSGIAIMQHKHIYPKPLQHDEFPSPTLVLHWSGTQRSSLIAVTRRLQSEKSHSPMSPLSQRAQKTDAGAVKNSCILICPDATLQSSSPTPRPLLIHLVLSVSSVYSLMSAGEGAGIIRAVWFCINQSIPWWMALSECAVQLCNCWQRIRHSIERDWFIIISIVLNVFSDFVLIFIDVLIWYPHQHSEQTAALLGTYIGPICVPAITKLLFRVT